MPKQHTKAGAQARYRISICGSAIIWTRGEYMLIDNSLNCVVMGSDYDASLSEIHDWLSGSSSP